MIPTDKKVIHEIGLDDIVGLLYLNPQEHLIDWIPQHLYVTSDEEIKEGDWITDGHKVYKAPDIDAFIGLFKIIATTDKSLLIKCDGCKRVEATAFEVDINKYLSASTTYTCSCQLSPELPLDFIKYYAKEYNNKKQIINILVEYNEILAEKCEYVDALGSCGLSLCPHSGNDNVFCNQIGKDILKVDVDNTIRINYIKDSWNKEELDIIINKALNDALEHGRTIGSYLVSGLPEKYAPLTEQSFKNNWFENNL